MAAPCSVGVVPIPHGDDARRDGEPIQGGKEAWAMIKELRDFGLHNRVYRDRKGWLRGI